MPQHLISVDEVVAMLETIGAAKETIRRFRQQADGVLAVRPSLGDEHVIVSSFYGAHTGDPGVNLEVGAARLQMSVQHAKKIGLDLIAGAEAAISERASHVLLDLRELRQGTRGTSWGS